MKKPLYLYCKSCCIALSDIEASAPALMEFIDDHRDCKLIRIVSEIPNCETELIPVCNIPNLRCPDLFVQELPSVERACDDCGAVLKIAMYRGKTGEYSLPGYGMMFDFPMGGDDSEIKNMCRVCLQKVLRRADERLAKRTEEK